MNPYTAFLTGLTTGGLTCFAVQGGLLLGLLARRTPEGEEQAGFRRLLLPVSAFLIAKLVSHALLGAALGWFGDAIAPSTTFLLWMQVVAAAFMIVAGIRLLRPSFLPWLNVMAPSPVRRFIRARAKSTSVLAPAILGFLTILIPCGTTQAIELNAIASGNPLEAAMILSAFVLGTAPLFLTIGILARGTSIAQRRLTSIAATVVIVLGVFAFNSVLVAIDSPYEFRNVATAVAEGLRPNAQTEVTDASSTATITVKPNGYSPSSVTVPSNTPVRFILKANGPLGCTSLFRIPKLNLETGVGQDSPTSLTATFPAPGRYLFTCGMGMYSGTINAV